MHVRGFTRHESSMTELPGTYLGLVEKLDHLKVLFRDLLEKNALLLWFSFKIIFVQQFCMSKHSALEDNWTYE